MDSSLLHVVSDASRLAIVNLLCLQNKRTLGLQLSGPDRDLFPLITGLTALHRCGKHLLINGHQGENFRQMTGLVTFDTMRLASGGLGRDVLGEKGRIWGGQHFAEERQCHLDAAAILSGIGNDAIVFFKVGRSILVDLVESLSLRRLDLLWPIGRGRKDLNQCWGSQKSILC
jgi:hypothetical protein